MSNAGTSVWETTPLKPIQRQKNSQKMRKHVNTLDRSPCQEAEPEAEIWMQSVRHRREQNGKERTKHGHGVK